jgi:hypothetical protein
MGGPSRPLQHVKYAKSGRPAEIYHNPHLILVIRRSFKRGLGIPPLGATSPSADVRKRSLIA